MKLELTPEEVTELYMVLIAHNTTAKNNNLKPLTAKLAKAYAFQRGGKNV